MTKLYAGCETLITVPDDMEKNATKLLEKFGFKFTSPSGQVVEHFEKLNGLQHYYLLLISDRDDQVFKLDFGPKTCKSAKRMLHSLTRGVPGETRINPLKELTPIKGNLSMLNKKFEFLGETPLKIQDIEKIANNVGAGIYQNSYNLWQRNCIGFCGTVCTQIGIDYKCSSLDGLKQNVGFFMHGSFLVLQQLFM